MELEAKVSLLKTGDDKYFEDIYLETNRLVFYVVTRLVKDNDAVKDIVQDTYISAYNNIDQLQDNNIQPWLNRIARNKSLDYLKKKRPLLFDDYTSENDDDFNFEIEDKDESLQPAKISEKLETERLIKEIIDELPEDQRVCIMLFYFEELTTKEIAEQLKISENSIKSRLRYGRIKIEGSVKEMEKKGVKLYDLSPIAFLTFLLKAGIENYAVPSALQLSSTTILATEIATSTVSGTTGTIGAKGVLTTSAAKIVISTVVVASTIGGGVYAYNSHENKNIEVLHNDQYVIEYGEEFNFDLIDTLYEDIEDNIEYEVSNVDNNKNGDTVFITDYEYLIKKTKMNFKVVVQDTQYPMLSGEQHYITEHGVEVDYKKITATDVVDGPLKVFYEGDVDFETSGEYVVISRASDSNENESTLEITIIVNEKEITPSHPLDPFMYSSGIQAFRMIVDYFMDTEGPQLVGVIETNLGDGVVFEGDDATYEVRIFRYLLEEYINPEYFQDTSIEDAAKPEGIGYSFSVNNFDELYGQGAPYEYEQYRINTYTYTPIK